MRFPVRFLPAFAFPLLLAPTAVRADKAAAETEVETLRTQCDLDVAKAVEPLDAKFATALDELRSRAMKAGDLDAALAIIRLRDEIPDAPPLDMPGPDPALKATSTVTMLRSYVDIRNKRAATLAEPVFERYRRALTDGLAKAMGAADVDAAVVFKAAASEAATHAGDPFADTVWNDRSHDAVSIIVVRHDGVIMEYWKNGLKSGRWTRKGSGDYAATLAGHACTLHLDGAEGTIRRKGDGHVWKRVPAGAEADAERRHLVALAYERGALHKPITTAARSNCVLDASVWYSRGSDGGPSSFVFDSDGTAAHIYHGASQEGKWEPDGKYACIFIRSDGQRWKMIVDPQSPDRVQRRNDGQSWNRVADDEAGKIRDDLARIRAAPKVAASPTPAGDTKPAAPASPAKPVKPGSAPDSDDTPFGKRVR